MNWYKGVAIQINWYKGVVIQMNWYKENKRKWILIFILGH
jgi:hypothetical protein